MDVKRKKEIDIRTSKATAVLRELYRSALKKRELSNTWKLPALSFWSFLVFFLSSPTVTKLGNNWRSAISRTSGRDIDFSKECAVWHFATNCAAVKSVKPRKMSQFSPNRDFSYGGSTKWMSQKMFSRLVLLDKHTGNDAEVVQGPGGVTTSPTLLGSRLGVEPTELSDISENREVFRVFKATTPTNLPRGKMGMTTNEWMNTKFFLEVQLIGSK